MSPSDPPRTLSLHERYAASRRCVDSPSVVSVAAVLRLDSDAAPTRVFEDLGSHLARRIDEALAAYPLLGYCVAKPRSKTPRWSPIVPTPTSTNILRIGPPLDAQPHAQLLSQAMLSDQAALPKRTPLDRGPLWTVSLQPIDTTSCLLILSTDHVINDGRGTLNLFSHLLSHSPLPPAPADPIPPASDRLFDFRPSPLYMLNAVFRELLLPKLPLPNCIKSKLQGGTSWPASNPADVAAAPKDCAASLDVVLIRVPGLVASLKAHSRLQAAGGRPATVHAILHNLALVALYAAVGEERVVFNACTPISLRDEVPRKRRRTALPGTTGNYVASYTRDFEIGPGTEFWTMTNGFSAKLSSRAGKSAAKQHMGLLAYIPDFEVKRKWDDDEKSTPSTVWDGTCLNGWEKFFATKASSSTPLDSALTVSNLGLVHLSSPSPHWSLDTVAWSQSHTPQGEAFGLDIVSLGPDSLSLAISCRPDAFKNAHLRQRFRENLQRLVHAFAVRAKQLDPTKRELTVAQMATYLNEH